MKTSVAHFRRILFKPTETFLHNTLVGMRRTRPVGVAFQREGEGQFAVDFPILELYAWGVVPRSWRALRARLRLGSAELRYDRRRTFHFLEQHSVRVLHAHFGYTGFQILPVKKRTGLPLITTFYGEDVSARARKPRWKRNYGELFDVGDLFLVEGPFMRERLVALGCPAEKVRVQRIAIPLERYCLRTPVPRSADASVRVLFAASLREKKGPLAAVEAVHRVIRRGLRVELTIIGDGPLRPQVEALLDRYKMRPTTRLLGMQPHARLLAVMQRTDIFLHPSVTATDGDSEGGAPTAILEAQACGLPVVSTTHADIPNVVIPGESALLSPEEDVEALAQNLEALVLSPERWAEMGRAGREFVGEHHDVSSEVARLEQLYLEAAG